MIKRRYEHLLVTSYITYYLLRLLAKNFKDRVHFQRVSGHYHRSHPNFLLQLSKEFDGCRDQFSPQISSLRRCCKSKERWFKGS